MAEPLKRIVKSANGKGYHSESSTTSEVAVLPPLTTTDAGQSVRDSEETKDEDAFCVPWYLP